MQQRYYDPIAGRFLSVDPVVTDAATGKSFGRYHYAQNNPFKYVDPDGRDYQFSGSKSFIARMEGAIGKLASKPHGRAMVQEMKDHKVMVTITEGKGGNSTLPIDPRASFRGEPQGSTLTIDPNLKEGPSKDVDGSKERPLEIALGHEISHANSIARGDEKAINGDRTGALTRSEIAAQKDEAILRKEQNVPQREVVPK